MDSVPTSPFGRGFIPASRDIGLPGEVFSPPPAHCHASGASRAARAQAVPAASAFAVPFPPDQAGAVARHDAFTAPRRAAFLHHLAHHGQVRLACAAVGVSAQAAYVRRRRDGHFAAGWDAALVLARDHAEQVLADRALHGVTETIFYRGEAVGTRTRFDPRLLLALIARLDRHHDAAPAARAAAARFDELLEDMLDAGDAPCGAVPERGWQPRRPAPADALARARDQADSAFPDDLDALADDAFDALHACTALPDDLTDADVDMVWAQLHRAHCDAAAQAAEQALDLAAQARCARIDALLPPCEDAGYAGLGGAMDFGTDCGTDGPAAVAPAPGHDTAPALAEPGAPEPPIEYKSMPRRGRRAGAGPGAGALPAFSRQRACQPCQLRLMPIPAPIAGSGRDVRWWPGLPGFIAGSRPPAASANTISRQRHIRPRCRYRC